MLEAETTRGLHREKEVEPSCPGPRKEQMVRQETALSRVHRKAALVHDSSEAC